MQRDFVPVLVQRENKKELWRIDVTNLSVIELIKLKEELKKEPYAQTIIVLDGLIYNNINELNASQEIRGNRHDKEMRKNKRQEKIRKKTKIKR